MDQVDGRIPLDNPPYVFTGWLLEATPSERARLQRASIAIYQSFEPVAVLDWEMASLGPRELDVGWFVFLHRFFQDIAEVFGLDGIPDFLRRSDVEQCYQELSGYPPRDMDFYLTYAAFISPTPPCGTRS